MLSSSWRASSRVSIFYTSPQGSCRVCLDRYFTFLHLVSYLTVNQQFGHEATENHSGQRQVMSEKQLFEGIEDEHDPVYHIKFYLHTHLKSQRRNHFSSSNQGDSRRCGP